jgi:hypothetical protein
LKLLKACQGNEDLTFKLGTLDTQDRAEISKHVRPASFALRQSYDIKKGWGKGFIWVAPIGFLNESDQSGETQYPDWRRSYSLEGILLHEWGHVFGTPHVDGTVMSKNIYLQVISTIEERRKFATKIDYTRELVVNSLRDFRQHGQLGTFRYYINPERIEDTTAANFLRLTGRARVGEIKSWYQVLDKKEFLNVSDDQGEFQFELTEKKGNASHSTDYVSVFQVLFTDERGKMGGSAHLSAGISKSMTMTTATGEKLSVRVGRSTPSVGMQDKDKHGHLTDLVNIMIEDPDQVTFLFGAGERDDLD